MRKIADYFLFSNFFISICAGAAFVGNILIVSDEFELNNFNLIAASLISILTYLGYNFQRILSLKKPKSIPFSHREEWFRTHYKLQLRICIVLIGASAILIYLLKDDIIYLTPLILSGAITLLYRLSFKAFEGLRNIPYIKIILIAISWSLSCALIPCVINELTTFETILICLRYFLFIVVITLPFDIRDLKIDTIITIPNKIGINATKWLCLILYLSMLFTDILLYNTGIFAPI